MRSMVCRIAILIVCSTTEPEAGQGRRRRPEGLALIRLRRSGISNRRWRCGLGPNTRELFRCLIGQRRMWPALVVVDAPARNLTPRVPEIPKPARIQAFITKPAMKTFNVAILRWFSGLNVNRANAALRAPGQLMPTANLGPVVRTKKPWCTALLYDSL
jgi:hypothetical protein